MQSIDVNEIKNLDKQYVIDIREAEELREQAIEGLVHIPMATLLENPAEYLEQDSTYYLMCHLGGRSMRACAYLSELGYDVVNLSGGIEGFEFD